MCESYWFISIIEPEDNLEQERCQRTGSFVEHHRVRVDCDVSAKTNTTIMRSSINFLKKMI